MSVLRPAVFQSINRLACSKCGAETNASCNCGAIYEVLAERRQSQREADARYSEKRKEKRKQKQSSVDIDNETIADPVEEECADCETPQDFWQRSLSNMAGDAIAMRAYWTRQFGEWESFNRPRSLVTLAEQAAAEWTLVAKFLGERK